MSSDVSVLQDGLTRRNILHGFSAVAGTMFVPQLCEARPGRAEIPPRILKPEVDHVISAIEQRLEILESGKTLYVAVGENHAISSHPAFVKKLITQLQSRGHVFAVGIESPYNHITKKASPYFRASSDDRRVLYDCDTDGRLSLHFSLSDYMTRWALVANRFLLETCLDLGVSTRFNDLPGIAANSDYLDLRDPMVRYFISEKARGHKPRRFLSCLDNEGMHLRNLALVANSKDHARDAGARIYILHTGSAHVFGERSHLSYRNSLASLWEAAGDGVLPVILASRNEITLPYVAQKWIDAKKAIRFHDLPNREFDNKGLSETQAARLMRKEADYLKRMGEADAARGIPVENKAHIKAFEALAKNIPCDKRSSLTARIFNPGL